MINTFELAIQCGMCACRVPRSDREPGNNCLSKGTILFRIVTWRREWTSTIRRPAQAKCLWPWFRPTLLAHFIHANAVLNGKIGIKWIMPNYKRHRIELWPDNQVQWYDGDGTKSGPFGSVAPGMLPLYQVRWVTCRFAILLGRGCPVLWSTSCRADETAMRSLWRGE